MKYLLALYLILLIHVYLLNCSKIMTDDKCSSTCLVCKNEICLNCPKGLFSYKNGCFNGCPENTIADNLASSCKFAEDEPIFIKAYTKSRCMNSCGKFFDDCR